MIMGHANMEDACVIKVFLVLIAIRLFVRTLFALLMLIIGLIKIAITVVDMVN